jgi:thiol-disulfide isomerase/thioredoxin
MKKKKLLVTAVFVLLFVALALGPVRHAITGFIITQGWFDSAPPAEIYGPYLTEETINAPLFTSEGEIVRLADFEDQVLFISFWATWCGTCRQTNPGINLLHNSMENRDDITVLLLSMDNVQEHADEYMQLRNFSVQNLFPRNILPEPLNSVAIPTTFVIDKNRQIVYRNKGYSNYSRTNFKRWIEEVADRG